MLAGLKRIIRGVAPTPAQSNVVLDKAPTVTEEPVIQPVSHELTFEDARLSGWMLEETGELLTGFQVREQDHVLDVGCGDGNFIHFCANRGAEVTFVDIDADKVNQVTQLLQGTAARAAHGLVSDSNPLPIPDNCFDKVIGMEVMEHVDDPAQFLAELVRVGKPGAQYLLSVPDAVSESVQQQIAPPVYFAKPNHINIFSRDEFSRLVTDAGLIIEHRAYHGFYWSVFWTFFWTCDQDLSPPWHPLLESWARTWDMMLKMRDGPRIKHALDQVMPKSQVIIARKPDGIR